jgi:hypothetical protein
LALHHPTKKKLKKNIKNVATLLYVEIFIGGMEIFTILAHLYR